MCIQNLYFVAIPIPEIIAIEVLGGADRCPDWWAGDMTRATTRETHLAITHLAGDSLFTTSGNNMIG